MDLSSRTQVSNITTFLKELMLRQVSGASREWLQRKLHKLQQEPLNRDLYLLFSAVPRFVKQEPLALQQKDLTTAHSLRQGWNPAAWDTVQAARVLAVLSFPHEDEESFNLLIEQLFTTAEVRELVALYSALPLFPFPESLKLRAAEGIRTNMTVVFDAVALNNPYPYQFLEEDAWNQMILKALFMGRPLYRIWGIDHRSNSSLSKMISDFAHERWAAGRSTSPEMWRPVKDHPSPEIYQDMKTLFETDDPLQHAAAVLALKALKTSQSATLLQEVRQEVFEVDPDINWDLLGQRWWRLQDLPEN